MNTLTADTEPLWTDVAGLLVSVVALIVLAVTLRVYHGQLKALRAQVGLLASSTAATTQQQKMQSMLAVTELLQSQAQRDSRGFIIEHTKAYRAGDDPAANFTPEYVGAADVVGHAMQTIGFYVDAGFIDRELVLSNWSKTILDSWQAARPWTTYRREDEGYPALWNDFEHLADAARDFLAEV